MAVDMRSRYFGEPEEAFMLDGGAMSPSLSVFPQAAQAPTQFEVMPTRNTSLMPAYTSPAAAMPAYTPPATAPVAQQYLPAVQPMTQEAAPAAFDPAMLQNLNLPDFSGGLGLTGATYSGPTQAFTAPLSNKGNPTSQLGGNQFYMAPDTSIRLVNNRTGQVEYEGTGYDAATQAIKAAQALTAAGGNKAGWDIQTATPGVNDYTTVANEKVNKSFLNTVANIVGTALPIAVGFIPGLQGVGAVLAAAGAGGAGAALRGQDILKGIAMGGLSAAGGQYLGEALKGAGVGLSTNAARAIGTGIGSTTGGVVTGQDFGNALLGGVASGGLSYLGGEIMKPGARTPSGADAGGNIANAPVDPSTLTVTGTRIANLTSPSVNFSSTNRTPPAQDAEVLDPNRITVTGTRTPDLTSPSVNFGATNRTPVAQDAEVLDPNRIVVTGTRTPDLTSSTFTVPGMTSNVPLTLDEIIATGRRDAETGSSNATLDPDRIVVTGKRIPDANTGSSVLTVPGTTSNATPDPNQIVVTGKRIPDAETGSSVLTVPGFNLPGDTLADIDKKAAEEAEDAEKKKKLDVGDALALLSLLSGVGGSGGGGGGGTAGSQALNPIFSAKLPTPGEGGAFRVGGFDIAPPAARPTADWYRYATGPAMDIPAGMNLSGATSPYAGYGPSTLGEETFKRVTGMSHGGSMGYARGSSRDSFAVQGPGTGRSDDIPAVLSDGEYVIDAETVALLGDGSSKAGAKKLDEMRVKVRKHKGRNLAKGKFSVNAKRPEKYLSGGRA